ncbi:MAG: hypothetical protein [Microviridae sp.]|nr:MAG: hypothetical protein [Microviridae sp.]
MKLITITICEDIAQTIPKEHLQKMGMLIYWITKRHRPKKYETARKIFDKKFVQRNVIFLTKAIQQGRIKTVINEGGKEEAQLKENEYRLVIETPE